MGDGQAYDLVIIGAGPGGYVAAIRAAQLGMNVACVERDATLGGTCLNVGCIPSKALLESSEHYWTAKKHFKSHGIRIQGLEVDLAAMMARKARVVKVLTAGIEMLFKKNKVTRVEGTGRIVAPGAVEVTGGKGTRKLETSKILIATGSTVAIPQGFELDGERIFTSTEALSLPEVPNHLGIIGAGVIGLELGSVWSRLGARVTVLELLPRVLAGFDTELASSAQKLFVRQGLKFALGARVTEARVEGNAVEVSYRDSDGSPNILTCDRLLVCVGRQPYIEGLGLEEARVTLDRAGRVDVNDRFETSVPGIYAIGDVIRGPMLAHKAEEEGIAAVELMAGRAGHVGYDAIPNVVYTHPEIASVGKTEDELKESGLEYRNGRFPFSANGRAKAIAQTDGFVKILADAKSDRILGDHILGHRAGDLIAELAVAVAFGGSAEDIARSPHAHPTLAEVIKEAALAVDGRQIHM